MLEAITINRFWNKVDKSAGPDACWPWTGSRGSVGYGRIKIKGKFVTASRVCLKIHVPCPDERMFACHTCDNIICCNPAHLWWGSHKQNMRDMVEKRRSSNRVGEKNPRAKLTAEDVINIRAHQGLLAPLAVAYGVSDTTITKIRSRRTWSHIA